MRSIVFGSPSQLPPTASFTASPTSGDPPLDVSFDARASTDPDKGQLSYDWDFGDGTRTSTLLPVVSHRYVARGAFNVTLRVSDGARPSAPVTTLIQVGDPPAASIQSPPTTARFAVGDSVTVTGHGTDHNGATLSGSSLSWTVIRHHGTHTHPFLGPVTGDRVAFRYPSPEDLEAAKNSYIEVRLTATDSDGARRTVTRDLLPRTVTLTVMDNRTTPMTLHANDVIFSGQRTFLSWSGYVVRLHAPSPQVFPDRYYEFQSWSDGGAATHNVVTPTSNMSYTANFTRKSGTAPSVPPAPPPPPPDPTTTGIVTNPTGTGYLLAFTNGKVEIHGNAGHFGDVSTLPLHRPIVGLAARPSGQGYWLVAADGGIFALGDAPFKGSTGGIALNQPVVGMAATPSARATGWWPPTAASSPSATPASSGRRGRCV